jgi:hypothetical protein
MEKVDKLTYMKKIDSSFLNDVTIYIDDMRILKNIFNEFIIYKDKLGIIDLDLNQLLAMVIYKNIYPFDFSQLQHNKGLVYDVLRNKDKIIRTRTHKLDQEIEKIQAKIKGTEREILTSLKELQIIYLDNLGIYRNSRSNNYSITINGTTYSSNYTNHQNFFDDLKNTKLVNCNLPKKRGNQISADEIATVFGSKKNYFEREEYIKIREEDKIDRIKEELAELKKQRAEVSMKSLKELIEESEPQDVFSDLIFDKKLLIYLLRHGYIDEMYNHYLTYFHSGSLTEADLKFIFSVKNRDPLEVHHSLNKIDKIIERLNGNEFKQVEALNYDLLNHLIENIEKTDYMYYFDSIMTQLSNETKKSIDFIDGFKQRTLHKPKFFQSICEKWDNIWYYIQKESQFTEFEKDSYLFDILSFANISDIMKINKGRELSNFISQHHDFTTIAPTDKDKLKQILLELDVKFQSLDKLLSDYELIEYVAEKDLYQINQSTLAVILGVPNEQLSYSGIQKSSRQDVLKYIDANIQIYIKEVLLKVSIKEETEQGLLDLLKIKDVSMELKQAIISESPVIFTDITKLEHKIQPMLLNFKKIDATWFNVIAYSKVRSTFDSELVNFLNNSEVLDKLSNQNISGASNADSDIEMYMSEQIIKNLDLTETSFKALTSCINEFNYFPIDSLPEERVKTMIIKGVLTLSIDNFESIKDSFKNMLQLYLEENIIEFTDHMDNFNLEHDDVVQLFDSDRISESHKLRLVSALNVNTLSKEDRVFAEGLSSFILENNMELSIDLFDWLISTDMHIDKKLMLISKKIDELDFTDITKVLSKLGKPYAEISKSGKRPQIKNNEVNQVFVKALAEKSYISSFSKKQKSIQINTKFNLNK